MSVTLKIALLAMLQGATEFLPVSSSGHLVLANHCMGLETPDGPFLEVILHTGTLLSITVYYRRRLLSLLQGVIRRNPDDLRFCGFLLLACLPAIMVYLALGDGIDALFSLPEAAAAMLCVTGVVVLSLRWAPAGHGSPGMLVTLMMGTAQALALIPGISRSGSTIAMGRWLKVGPEEAAETSFLMVLPLLAGAAMLELVRGLAGNGEPMLAPAGLILGFFLAALTGYAALAFLVRLLAGRHLYIFGIYCLLTGILAGSLLIVF